MAESNFHEYSVAAPTYEQVAADYEKINAALDSATDADGRIAAVIGWDKLRRQLSDWHALTEIRFHQDTRSESYKQAKEYCDQLRPKLTDLDVNMKRRLLESPYSDDIAARFGRQSLDLWQCDIAAFDPAIQDDLVAQSKLESEFTELLASAKFEYRGETHTLSQMAKFVEHPERDVRHESAKMRSDWFSENQDALDRIFDELVKLRHTMARKLDYEDFVGLGYKLMHRVDYDQQDVEAFRAQVRDHVVPLCVQLKRKQAARLGVDPLMAWDNAIHDPAGNPAPQGDHDWMVQRAQQMFRDLGGGMDDFFDQMRSKSLLDLKSREGKAGGGFCEALPVFGMPFIYANFNGTKGDVEVFTHEMGHAYQVFSSRGQPLCDYLWATNEACEIHSMGLEFLTWPHMELFFGDEAERFRRIHLAQSITFLPYGVAVDHFQHLVYAQPDATPQERNAMWQEMERTYLPWLNWGDLAHQASGRRWQAQLHIYQAPFYYIDYTLALTCAMQLWVKSEQDKTGALDTYVALCRRGGEAPFQQLVDSAGLVSPFAEGCLKDVVHKAEDVLTAV